MLMHLLPPFVLSRLKKCMQKPCFEKHLVNRLENDESDPWVAFARGRTAASALAQGSPGEDEHGQIGGGVVHRRLTTVDETTRAAQV
jgi:hypothetical protein